LTNFAAVSLNPRKASYAKGIRNPGRAKFTPSYINVSPSFVFVPSKRGKP